MSPSIPELKLFRPVGDVSKEWPIDRNVLLEIAPDREALIMGTDSIWDIRDVIKVPVTETDPK